MPLGDTVRETLKREYEAGATYQTIALRHNISIPYARGLILGEDRSGGISLDKLEAMFPLAHLDLTGSGSSQVMQINGDSNHHISQGGREDYRHRLVEKVVALDIPDDARTKVLRLILSE